MSEEQFKKYTTQDIESLLAEAHRVLGGYATRVGKLLFATGILVGLYFAQWNYVAANGYAWLIIVTWSLTTLAMVTCFMFAAYYVLLGILPTKLVQRKLQQALDERYEQIGIDPSNREES